MAAEIYAHIGAAIRRRRDALGLSQAQLADKVGLVRTSITMIESGSQALQVHQLVDICTVLKKSPSELLTEALQQPERPAERTLFQESILDEFLVGLAKPITRITRS